MDRKTPRDIQAVTGAVDAEGTGAPLMMKVPRVRVVGDELEYPPEALEVAYRRGRHDEARNHEESPGAVQRTLLGLEPLEAAPGASVVMHLVAHRPLRIMSILVDYVTAEAFELLGMRIGHRECAQLGACPVPLSMMGAEVNGWPRACEISGQQEDGPDLWTHAAAQREEPIRLELRNAGKRATRFRGVLRVEVLGL